MTRPEKESVRPRRGIEEVAQFAEGVHIKAWGQWSYWRWMGLYSRKGGSTPPPPPLSPAPTPYQFQKEKERGKWEDISTAIKSVAGHNGGGGGGGYVESRES